jgi:hypothetical protein
MQRRLICHQIFWRDFESTNVFWLEPDGDQTWSIRKWRTNFLEIFLKSGSANLIQNYNSILWYESYKKHFIARTVLEHDERSEECPKGVSAIKCLINEMSYSIFSTLPLFQWKKKNFKFKTVKVEGFHPRSRLRSAARPQYPSKLKNEISLFLVLLLYHAFSYYDTQNSIVIASVRTQSRKNILCTHLL